MDESALQNRLETIERRQSVGLALLVGLYLLGGLWLVGREVPAFTAWHAGGAVVAFGIVAWLVVTSRRRRAR